MAARTCSKPVTQTARKGAHQGAAKRQARKMLRQVRDPIKNNGASSKHCYATQGRWLPCHIHPASMVKGRLPDNSQYRGKGPKADSPKAVCRLAAFLLTPTFFLLPEKDV